MHWHKDFQFNLVLSGDVFIHTLDKTIIVHTGESILINKSVVHLVLGTDNCHYISFVFPEYLVSLYPQTVSKHDLKAPRVFGVCHPKPRQKNTVDTYTCINRSVPSRLIARFILKAVKVSEISPVPFSLPRKRR